MPKSEAANPRRTDNAMTNKKEKKGQKDKIYQRNRYLCIFLQFSIFCEL